MSYPNHFLVHFCYGTPSPSRTQSMLKASVNTFDDVTPPFLIVTIFRCSFVTERLAQAKHNRCGKPVWTHFMMSHPHVWYFFPQKRWFIWLTLIIFWFFPSGFNPNLAKFDHMICIPKVVYIYFSFLSTIILKQLFVRILRACHMYGVKSTCLTPRLIRKALLPRWVKGIGVRKPCPDIKTHTISSKHLTNGVGMAAIFVYTRPVNVINTFPARNFRAIGALIWN